jgi:hypothetical protein
MANISACSQFASLSLLHSIHLPAFPGGQNHRQWFSAFADATICLGLVFYSPPRFSLLQLSCVIAVWDPLVKPLDFTRRLVVTPEVYA